MPRPEKNRKIHQPPLMMGFKPFGIPLYEVEKINLTFEEYESIRLVIYKNLHQEKAAKLMDVSRPTLTRIYNKALKNIAKAFIEGKAIEFEGGNYELDGIWYRCGKCYNLIEHPENNVKCDSCTDNKKDELIKLNNRIMPKLEHKGPEGLGLNTGQKLRKCRKTEAENKEQMKSNNVNFQRCGNGKRKNKRQ